MTALIVLGCVLWYVSGVAGWIYLWTSENDLRLDDLLMTLLFGLLGPMFVLMAAATLKSTPIVMRKRK